MNTPITIASGATTSSFLVNSDGWVIINPASGASAFIEYTTGTAADVAGGSAVWVAYNKYSSNAAVHIEEELQSVYVRITASAGTVNYSVEGGLSSSDRLQIRQYIRGSINSLTNPRTRSISADITISESDDASIITLTVAAVLTIPASLSPRPAFIVIPPASGNASIAVSGGATVNGSTTTQTRSRASNVAGFVVQPYAESDGYGASGS
jgi:hypothetical protein